MKCHVLFILLLISNNFEAKGQDGIDLANLYELKIFKTDSLILSHHTTKVLCFEHNSLKLKRTKVFEKTFDRFGRIVEFTEFNKNGDSLTLKLVYKSDGLKLIATIPISIVSFHSTSNENSWEFYNWDGYKIFFDRTENKNVLLFKREYKLTGDSSIETFTTVNGGKTLHNTFRYSFNSGSKEKLNAGENVPDTIFHKDTLILNQFEINDGGITTTKSFFYKENLIQRDVFFSYGDSIVEYQISLFDYDDKNRPVLIKEYVKDNSKLTLISTKKIKYDTEGKTEYEDKNISDGKTDEIKKYDRSFQLIGRIFYQNFFDYKNNKSVMRKVEYKMNYTKKGLIEKERLYINNTPTRVRFFKYL